jgi:tripartite-type tricarboxylate transporter receptor subunit TctC
MRTLVFSIALCIFALAGLTPVAAAQATLPKSIKIVVPFSPGGSNDVIARALAGPLAKRLDIPVIVENKAGAAGVVGADYVAKSPPDGSTLLLTSSSFLTAAATQTQLPRPGHGVRAGRDGRTGPMLLVVSATTPYKSPADLVAAARAKPGVLNYGTAGVGSIAHLTTELLDDTAKIQMVHVPYKGAANAATDLAGGQIQVMISNYSTLAPLIKSGKVKALAVTSSSPRRLCRFAASCHRGRGLRRRHLGRRLRASGHTPGGGRPSESGDRRHRRVAGTRPCAGARRHATRFDAPGRVLDTRQGRTPVETDRRGAQDRRGMMRERLDGRVVRFEQLLRFLEAQRANVFEG